MIQEIKSAITPLTLGTVQLGMAYGIANQHGRPDINAGHQILRRATELSVTTWDTSRHYGVSEEVIGSFLSAEDASHPFIISKFKWGEDALGDEKLAMQEALAHVKKSLQVLGVENLPLLLYHKDKDQTIGSVMKFLPGVLKSLREEGLIKAGGISLYYPQDAPVILDEPEITGVQLPINVFDQRLLADDTMGQLSDAGKLVFARSVFLQGLFFLPQDKLPHSLKEATCYIEELQRLAEEAEMSVAQFAFSYVRDIKGVSSIVFGADNVGQVEQNVKLLEGNAIPEDIREKVGKVFSHVAEKIITPGLWKS